MALKKVGQQSIITVGEFAREIARMFPPRLAESWDNVGLLIGDPGAPVRRVMTCLEVTAPTIAEAKKAGADLIVAHHPLIFKPFKTILASDPAQALAAELIRAGIGLIAAHTNLDAAPWGTNQVLAEVCGLTPSGALAPQSLEIASGGYKFVVYVPKGTERAVIDAIDRAGGGQIGLYTHCTFRSEGMGTFRGGKGTHPAVGAAGAFEEVLEFRLESVVPAGRREEVLAEVLKVHPYEEPAYDFYALAGQDMKAGLGCICEIPKGMPVADLVKQIKAGMGLKEVRVSGPAKGKVKRIAICTGSGGSFIGLAASRGADVYLTGEISYHHGVEAHQRGLTVIEVGHFESEVIVAGPLAKRLQGEARIQAAGVEVFAATRDLQPFVSL